VWAWVYLGVALASLILGGFYVLKVNPQAINERGRPPECQKSWDKVVIAINTVLTLGVYIVSGLDARFGWSAVPLWLHLLGILFMAAGGALTYAAMAHNKFLSMYVQVSEQRGHQVATSGPYLYVRHPMYASLILSWPAVSLLLGSYWGLLCGVLAVALIVVRTALEDRTLQAELSGYAQYAQQVRYRLIPGVW
jgi:protein-S-isoprenylcysteine O-methyltransferase Ste14